MLKLEVQAQAADQESQDDDEQNADNETPNDDQTELITFDYGEHDYAAPRMIDFSDHSYAAPN